MAFRAAIGSIVDLRATGRTFHGDTKLDQLCHCPIGSPIGLRGNTVACRLRSSAMQRAQSRRLAPTEADAYGPASIDREIRGIRFRLPHYGIIRDDQSCSELKFMRTLVNDFRAPASYELHSN